MLAVLRTLSTGNTEMLATLIAPPQINATQIMSFFPRKKISPKIGPKTFSCSIFLDLPPPGGRFSEILAFFPHPKGFPWPFGLLLELDLSGSAQ